MEALRDSLLMIQSMQRDGMLTAEEVRFSVCVHVNSNGRGRRDPGTGKCSKFPAAVRLWRAGSRAGAGDEDGAASYAPGGAELGS